MCPQSVVAGGDSETGHEIIDDSPDGSLDLEGCPERLHATVQRNADDQGDIQPVDVLVPIRLGDGGVGNVRLFRIILGVSIRLRWLCHRVGLRREVFRLDSQMAGGGLVGGHTLLSGRWTMAMKCEEIRRSEGRVWEK